MNPPVKNIRILPAALFLTSKRLLELHHAGNPFRHETVEAELLQETRSLRPDIPDHLIKKLIARLVIDENYNDTFLRALDTISDYFLDCKENGIYVRDSKFQEWQDFLTLTTSIPFVAYKLLHCNKSDKSNCAKILGFSSLVEPYVNDSKINDLLNDLAETHLHINGTSEVIYVWQHYLNRPETIKNKIAEPKDYAIELDQIGLKSYGELYRILKKSKHVQELLASGNKNNLQEWRKYLKKRLLLTSPPYADILSFRNGMSPFTFHPKNRNKKRSRGIPCHECELWLDIIKCLKIENEKKWLFILPHYYLLAYSLFHRLLTQQVNQYGFGQFQIIADHNLRDSYEDTGFLERFLQLGENGSLKSLEMRFTPRKTKNKYAQRFLKIKHDHGVYKNYTNRFNLTRHYSALNISSVIHFIKRKELTDCMKYQLSKSYMLQQKIFRESSLLVGFFNHVDYKYLPESVRNRYINLFTGIDAAGNELYARPEVFASSFRYLRNSFKNRYKKNLGITFHAGEDFIHVISGIRYIYEAVDFLDLNKGDRIGHGTALGIDYHKWRNKYNNYLIMEKGEHLDNLIFVSKLLELDIFDEEIGKFWKEIYGNDYPGIKTAFRAYTLRRGPDISTSFHGNESGYYKKNENSDEDGAILQLYNSCRVRKKYKELIEVDLKDVDDQVILCLQNHVLNILRQKEIAIESMITSNTRISIYETFDDHHITRWLTNSFAPPVLLASDDPGIFSTNLKNEYFHLYFILIKKFARQSTIAHMEKIKKDSNDYLFPKKS